MLKFYHGTQLENLADQLVKELDKNPPENLLDPEIFVVQNHGIGQWLSLYMAENTEEGIAANLEFEFPSERIWKLIRLIDPDIPENLPSDRQPMTWALMELFSQEEFLDDFSQIRRYISAGNSSEKAMRRWKLADKIADVFDQYLIYRPRMILNWQDQKLYTESVQAEKWQMQLWNKLLAYWNENYDGEYLHRAELQQQLWEKIDNRDLNTQDLPDRITVFGVSTASPAFIETMVKLSKLTEVYFYQLSVDPEIKESKNYQNPLLQSLGDEETNFISLLLSFVQENKKVTNQREWKAVESIDTSNNTVFGVVQSDIKEDCDISGGNLDVPAVDPTIQVHSCHSPMREVEVLYDQLLAILDENPDMSPDDILIMTPDIETYAPMIEAVFETPDEGQPQIPYSIADQGIQGTNSAIQSYLSILELVESRFKVTDVLDLLDANPIQEAFDFSKDDLNRLEGWIEDNRIRWGIDAPFKQNVNVPKSNSFTWKSGLNRMLLGYAMKQEDELLYNDIFPYSEIETSEDAELAGKFSQFLRALFEVNKYVQIERRPKDWKEYLIKIIDGFLPKGRDYFWEVSQIRGVLTHLADYASLAGYGRKVPFAIVRRWIQEHLQDSSTGGGRLGRGVTFSSLKPMRSIPFDVIGMIGMNEVSFPRSKIPIEFDLMHLNPDRGDPSQSEEDRYMFLVNMLSARTHIYFSYIGQSNRQDTKFPPSVVLKEFLDYLEEQYGLKSENLIQKHRLQAFSPAYFKRNNLFSFSNTQLNISQQLVDGRPEPSGFMSTNLPPSEEEWKQLSVGDLISFFQHPAKFTLRKRLGIYLREDDVIAEDREPFSLSGLEEYNVGQELLDRYIQNKSLDSYKQILESRDMLPEGWSGQQAYRQKASEVRTFGAAITDALNQESLEDCEVDVSINGFRIVGTLSGIYEEAQITYRFGSMRPKDLIDVWIRHLLFHLVKPETHPGYSNLFTRDKKTPFAQYRLSPLSNTKSLLADLLGIYWEGLQRCIYFFPKTSFAYAHEVCFRGKDPESGIKKASYQWNRDYGSYPGEVGDPYNKLVLGTQNPLKAEEFTKTATQFWAPFFEVLNQEEG